MTPGGVLHFEACGCAVRISTEDAEAARLAASLFSAFAPSRAPVRCELHVALAADGGYEVHHGPERAPIAHDDLAYALDKRVTLALQRLRPDLLFLHAAALRLDGAAVLLPAAAGGGKSTTVLAALDAGFSYLSDELAPVDVATGRVWPYPRALCLKAPPPAPYRLPDGVMAAGGHFYVPSARSADSTAPVAVDALAFPARQRPEGAGPLSTATAATQLLATTLNARAHPADGLDAVLALARRVPAVVLDTSALPAAVARLRTLLAASR